MKYFRSYPYLLQLLLLVLMLLTFMSAASFVIPALMMKSAGFSLDQMKGLNAASPHGLVVVIEWAQGAFNLFMFCLPALLYAYLATPRPAAYLGLRRPGKPVQLLLAVLIMVGATPVLSAIDGLVGLINFSPAIKADQKANDDMMSAFLTLPDFASFARAFTIFAIVPALGEELFFRGLLLRFSRKKSPNMLWPIVFTAVVFASTHSNIYGMLSIFTAGVLLAVIYNLTGSIWCSILGHLFFNGTQVLLSYLGQGNAAVRAFMESNTVPAYLISAGIIVSCGAFYLLWKNRTPLASNWAGDFTSDELSQKAY